MLFGRNAEIGRIEHLIRDACRALGGALVLRGEPGIGKSALLDGAEKLVEGVDVLRTRGAGPDAGLPFAGLFDLFRPVFDVLDRLPPAQREGLMSALGLAPPVRVDRFAIATGTLALLAAAADRRPLLVIVDDAQWLDDASMDAVLFAGRRLRHDRISFLFAVRTNEAPPGLVDGFEVLDLDALPAAEITTLAEASANIRLAPDVLRFLVGATGGNPLTIIETVRALDDAQLAGRTPLPTRLPRSISAVEIYHQRIARLGRPATQLLSLIALEPTNDPALLRTAASSFGLDRTPLLEELEGAALIELEYGNARLQHPLVRSALEGVLDPAALRASHRALGEALAERPDPTPAAWHLAAAATGPDQAVTALLERAGEAARSRSAYATAALAYERAAQLGVGDEDRSRHLLRAAEASRYAGRAEHGRRLLGEALDLAGSAATMSQIESEKARCELYFGRALNARQLFEDSAARIQDESPVESAVILAQAACAAVLTGDSIQAVGLARRAEAANADRPAQPVIELALGYALLHQGDVPASLTVLRRAARLTWELRANIDPDCLPFAVLALTWVGDIDEARSLANRVLAKARDESAFGYLCFIHYAAAYLEARTGHLVLASVLAAEGVSMAETTGATLWRYLSLCCLAFIEAAQGRTDECRAHAQEAIEIARAQEFAYPATIHDALGLLELSMGNPEQAITHLEPVNVRPGTNEPALGRPTGPDLVEAYLRCGRELPAGLLRQLEAVSSDQRFPAAAAAAERCLGLASGDAEFEDHFERSLSLQDEVNNPLMRARTEFCFGERLRRIGQRRRAREHLKRAHALFVELGAPLWASRVNEELRAAGGASRSNPPAGLADLTTQELQVAMAVAGGATNREAGAELYLSPKTIEFHLSQVYRKLGIRSRSQLAAHIVTRRDATERVAGSA